MPLGAWHACREQLSTLSQKGCPQRQAPGSCSWKGREARRWKQPLHSLPTLALLLPSSSSQGLLNPCFTPCVPS